MAIYNIRTTSVQDWRDSMMSKAEFNAMAAETRRNNAGSGAINFGKGSATTALNVNEGIHTSTTIPNTIYLGKVSGTGTSTTDAYIASINGSIIAAKYLSTTTADATLLLPPAPTVMPSTATLTQQQIDSGVIKHADASNSGLIINGKFTADASGWDALTANITYSSGAIAFNNPTAGSGLSQSGRTFVVGKRYILEFEITAYTSGSIGVRFPINLTATQFSGTGRKTIEFIYSGTSTSVFLQAVASTVLTIDNIAVFPADAISRSDFVFLKKNVVDLSVDDFFYPLGNRQFLGTTADGLNTVAGSFASAPTYSLFSDVWQADSALIGKGYIWSTLSDLNKKAVTENPENNAYLDGDKVYQAQYIAKVELMKDDTFTDATAFTSLGYTIDTVDKGLYKHADGSEAIGICLVHRRNQGFMHPVYNPNGTKLSSDSLPWYSTTVSFTSIADCFTESKLLATSGYIGTTSGRADVLFYDQIHEGDITDLRNNSAKVQDYNRFIDREFNKLVVGTYRGSEGEWNTIFASDTTTVGNSYLTRLGAVSTRVDYTSNPLSLPISTTLFAEVDRRGTFIKDSNGVYYRVIEINVSSSGYMAVYLGHEYGDVRSVFAAGTHNLVVSNKVTRTKSNTITHTDILGSPANYPVAWKQSGVSGTPLIVAEDGTSLLPTGTTGSDGLAVYKLSHKANASPLQVLKSTDSGATWAALTVTTHYTFSTTTNAITFTAGNIPLVTHLVKVVYQTHTSMATPTVNSEVLAIGEFTFSSNNKSYAALIQSLIGKVATDSYSNNSTVQEIGYV